VSAPPDIELQCVVHAPRYYAQARYETHPEIPRQLALELETMNGTRIIMPLTDEAAERIVEVLSFLLAHPHLATEPAKWKKPASRH
jgi:Uma2 family endonuclease